MSTTTIYVFQEPDWTAKVHTELKNSWGWAAFVYEALLRRYSGQIRGIKPGDRYLYGTHNWAKLWEQEAEIPFEPWERNVLRATYDRAIIRGLTPLARIAGEMRRFQREHHHPWDGVCHLDTIGVIIEKLLFDMGHTWKPTAIGFQPTSVAEELWRVPVADDPDETRMYDLQRDKLHHEVELVPSIWDR